MRWSQKNYPDYMSNCQASMNQTVSGTNCSIYDRGGFLQWVSTSSLGVMFDKFDNWQEGNPASPTMEEALIMNNQQE